MFINFSTYGQILLLKVQEGYYDIEWRNLKMFKIKFELN